MWIGKFLQKIRMRETRDLYCNIPLTYNTAETDAFNIFLGQFNGVYIHAFSFFDDLFDNISCYVYRKFKEMEWDG